MLVAINWSLSCLSAQHVIGVCYLKASIVCGLFIIEAPVFAYFKCLFAHILICCYFSCYPATWRFVICLASYTGADYIHKIILHSTWVCGLGLLRCFSNASKLCAGCSKLWRVIAFFIGDSSDNTIFRGSWVFSDFWKKAWYMNHLYTLIIVDYYFEVYKYN